MNLQDAKAAVVSALHDEGLDMDAVKRLSPALAAFGAAIARDERAKREAAVNAAVAEHREQARKLDNARRAAQPPGSLSELMRSVGAFP